MRIFYNPDTRQEIIMINNFACAFYLQADETPASKADEVIEAYNKDKNNISVCQEVFIDRPVTELPVEDGPEDSAQSSIDDPLKNDTELK